MKDSVYTHPRAKNQNRALVLRLICTGRANTRSDLSRMTGLSKMTLSNIVGDLLAEDYICEIDRCTSGASQGRKPITLEISPGAPYVVGIFVARTECSLVVSTIGAALVKRVCFRLPADISADTLLEKLHDSYLELTQDVGRRILGIGIASIGPIDKAGGTILNPPDFYNMRNISIKAFFEEKSGLPVFFDNNMNASVLAEKLFGHGKELSNILYLGVLHGVGAGIISGGHLLEGPTGINGEIGHTSINFDGALCQCGNRGCLELYASIPRVVANALNEMKAMGLRENSAAFDWPQLVEAARGGDYYCLRALDRLCEYLTVGIVNLINLFDCEEVFLGHDIALAEGLVEAKLEQSVNQHIFAMNIKRVRVRMSAFGLNSPLVGSISLVMSSYFADAEL